MRIKFWVLFLYAVLVAVPVCFAGPTPPDDSCNTPVPDIMGCQNGLDWRNFTNVFAVTPAAGCGVSCDDTVLQTIGEVTVSTGSTVRLRYLSRNTALLGWWFSSSCNSNLGDIGCGGATGDGTPTPPSCAAQTPTNRYEAVLVEDATAGTYYLMLGATSDATGIFDLEILEQTATPTPTPTLTPTATPSPSPSPSPTETETPTPSPTETETPSPSPTETETPSPSPTETETPSPSPTPTETPTATPTDTPTMTPTSTPTNTPTSTPTQTPTNTPTRTPTTTPVMTNVGNTKATVGTTCVYIMEITSYHQYVRFTNSTANSLITIAIDLQTCAAGEGITLAYGEYWDYWLGESRVLFDGAKIYAIADDAGRVLSIAVL